MELPEGAARTAAIGRKVHTRRSSKMIRRPSSSSSAIPAAIPRISRDTVPSGRVAEGEVVQDRQPEMQDSRKLNFKVIDDGSSLVKEDTLYGWLCENGRALDVSEVKGSLARHSQAWSRVTSDPEILRTVQSGYVPPFSTCPQPFADKNNVSATSNYSFVIKAVMEMLVNGFAKLTRTPPEVINPFTVSVQANGKKRLIADLRHLNRNLDPPKFKLEDIRAARPALKKAQYLFSFNFHKAFYHIDLDPSVQQLFGFSFWYKGQRYYGYHTIACFGLNTLPWLFTKLLRPFIQKWRKAGLHIFLYLDDGLGVCGSLEEAHYFSALVRADLRDAGMTEQSLKCHWEPCKELPWLGLLICLARMIIAIPADKRQRAKDWLKKLSAKSLLSPRELLQFAGLINSMAVVIGPKAYIRTKPLFQEVSKRAHGKVGWDDHFKISSEARNCLQFWVNELDHMSWETPIDSENRTTILFSDASATGGAAFLHAEHMSVADMQTDMEALESQGPLTWSHQAQDMFLRVWTDQETTHSSTWRELVTIEAGLRAFADRLQGRTVLWYSDNAGCASIARKGSMKPDLNLVADRLVTACAEHKIDFHLRWIRRNKNEIADTLSRFIDLDDWGIKTVLKESLEREWGCCTMDRFATDKNAKLIRFNSRFACSGSEAIDSFSQDWSGEVNWLVPPPHLIPQALLHLEKCRARAILVAPFWPSSRFWPFLFSWKGTTRMVVDWKEFKAGRRFLIAGDQPGSIFTPELFKGSLLAVLLDTNI